MRDGVSPNVLMVDFFTRYHRISGSVDVRSRRLADQLEDRTTDFIELEDAYVSRVEYPGDIIASQAVSVLRKETILVAVVAREEDGLTTSQSYGSYLGPHFQTAFLIVSDFEVQGYLRLWGKRHLRSVLTSGKMFVTVQDGTMRYSGHPEVEFTGAIILVNRTRVEAIWQDG
ncbi:MAG: hypothetical protein PVH41_00035 [Anaerolineae bacterium]|jgi:hypothetical protein